MNYIIIRTNHEYELYHYGIPGMKWGHRKAQYYETVGNRYHTMAANKAQIKVNRLNSSGQTAKAALVSKKVNTHKVKAEMSQQKHQYKQTEEYKAAKKKQLKRVAKGAAVAATIAASAYGAYKLNKYVKTKNGQIAAKRGYDYAEKVFQSDANFFKNSLNGATKGNITINANSGKYALREADRVANDNFRTAAKNVAQYRKKNGKGSLQKLSSVGFLGSQSGSSITYKK